MPKINRVKDWIRWELQYNSIGDIQKLGIPAPLTKRIRQGKRVNFSEKSLLKLESHYKNTWLKKLTSSSIPENHASDYIKIYTPDKLYQLSENAGSVARKILAVKLKDWKKRVAIFESTGLRQRKSKRGSKFDELKKPTLKAIKKGLSKSSRILLDWVELITAYTKLKNRNMIKTDKDRYSEIVNNYQKSKYRK